tara:strand:+ start:494 stop:910 length:417 start_codon:yes stop_codon:yes gene_type:complete
MVLPMLVGVAVVSGAAYYYQKDKDGVVTQITKEAFDAAVAAGTPIAQEIGDALQDIGGEIKEGLVSLGSSFGNELLELIEGAGVAIVKGLDRTADYVYERTIAGKEPDIIAGFTVTILSIAAAVYLYQSVKNANDAFN